MEGLLLGLVCLYPSLITRRNGFKSGLIRGGVCTRTTLHLSKDITLHFRGKGKGVMLKILPVIGPPIKMALSLVYFHQNFLFPFSLDDDDGFFIL